MVKRPLRRLCRSDFVQGLGFGLWGSGLRGFRGAGLRLPNGLARARRLGGT